MANINTDVVKVNKLRINKLRTYLFTIINEILDDTDYQINANMLSNDINNYSLDKIPIQQDQDQGIEKWITGTKLKRDVYSFRSRNNYSQDAINNLLNVGFFEIFEKIIYSNNDTKVLPDIEGIQSIKCLNCGSMNNATTNTAEFDIQIEITYKEE